MALPLPIVIAHRGASGYLPEHTLEAKALAYAMGADYLEQDCVLTADDVPVVLHDVHLDTVTNVATRFGDRKREDGRYYAVDFTLAEIKSLNVTERIDLKTGKAVYPNRFPAGEGDFAVPTLAEEIVFLQSLNRSTAKNVGIYPEIKSPAWHRQQGKDISRAVLNVLQQHGYRTKDDACFVQCFDAEECSRLREDLGCEMRLIQLIGENDWGEASTDYDALRTPAGLKQVADYADGIGPHLSQVIKGVDSQGVAQLTGLVKIAHEFGLEVHPYTLRVDAMPDWASDFDRLVRAFFDEADVDGIFTDFPDQVVQVRNRLSSPDLSSESSSDSK